MTEKKWEGTTFGNSLMHKWLIKLLRGIDIRIIYFFTYVFVIPPCLLRPGFKPIYHYFRERWKLSPIKAFIKTYQNHYMFGQVVIDRFAMYAGKRFHMDIEGYDHFLSLAKQQDGFILLSSHIGNYEIAGYTLVAEDKPFNTLVFFGEKQSIMDYRNQMFADTNIRMIPVSSDMSHLFEIDHALQNGETVSMPADRINGSQKCIEHVFLGAKAKFPLGPFSVATMRGLDVLAVNVMKDSLLGYKIYVTPLAYDKEASRQEQIRQLSSAYVAELEKRVRQYPTQWYNYFEFWQEG